MAAGLEKKLCPLSYAPKPVAKSKDALADIRCALEELFREPFNRATSALTKAACKLEPTQ